MLFTHMPGLNATYGFFVVIGLMATSCLILFLRFKKAKWL